MPATPEHASFVRRNGLTLAFVAMMLMSLVGHALTGWHVEAQEREEHREAPPTLIEYLGGGQFMSTLFENWESEFLQMGLFVLLTAKLRQKGASESRPVNPAEESPKKPVPREQQPWPARQGGAVRKVYEHSLSIALGLLFVASFALHGVASWRQHVEKQLQHGEAPNSLADHFVSAQMWFESFQNWQSEFLAVITLVLLSIVLREKDSTESKDVEAPHSQTGT